MSQVQAPALDDKILEHYQKQLMREHSVWMQAKERIVFAL
jgi:hypothetical protein